MGISMTMTSTKSQFYVLRPYQALNGHSREHSLIRYYCTAADMSFLFHCQFLKRQDAAKAILFLCKYAYSGCLFLCLVKAGLTMVPCQSMRWDIRLQYAQRATTMLDPSKVHENRRCSPFLSVFPLYILTHLPYHLSSGPPLLRIAYHQPRLKKTHPSPTRYCNTVDTL